MSKGSTIISHTKAIQAHYVGARGKNICSQMPLQLYRRSTQARMFHFAFLHYD